MTADVPAGGRADATEMRVGAGFGLVSERTIAVLEPTNGLLAEQLWALVESGADLDDVLEAMSVQGLRSLGAFAMARFEGGSVRVVVRGHAVAAVEHGGSVTEVQAEGVRTWVERVVVDPDAVTVRLGPPAQAPLPYRALGALLPADLLVRRLAAVAPALAGVDASAFAGFAPPLVTTAAAVPPPPFDAPTVPPAPAAPPVAPAPPALSVSAVGAAPSPPPPPATGGIDDDGSGAAPTPPWDGPDADDGAGRTFGGRGDGAERGAVSPLTLTAADVDDLRPAPAPEPTSDDDFDYDALYGHTQARSIQRAARGLTDPAEAAPHPGTGAASAHGSAEPGRSAGTEPSVFQPSALAPSPGPTTSAAPAPGGLIERVPTGSPGSPGAAETPSAHTPSGGLAGSADFVGRDGQTMSREQLAALKAGRGDVTAPSPGSPTLGGPTVLAVPCAAQHPNPPQATLCRICRAPVQGTPIVVSRPRLGQLRFSDGRVVPLDRPLVIGRNPRIDVRPGELPLPLKLDVGQGLSRTHAAVRLEDWQVMLEDLGSANGTVVTLRGREPRRLHVGEPAMLEDGAHVDFGGEITATYEAAS